MVDASASTMKRHLITQISRCDNAASPAQKEEQGTRPCSKNCVDPFFPAKFRFDLLAGGTTLLVARQGSSRDLDHQARARSPSLWTFS